MLKLSVLAGFLVAAGSVHAGRQLSGIVATIFSNPDGTGYVYGTLSDTRASADDIAYIACYYGGVPAGRVASCVARDPSGTFGSCWSSDPSILAAIETVQSDGNLRFTWNKNGSCSWVETETTSMHAPKQP
jgi:hypothetical protein